MKSNEEILQIVLSRQAEFEYNKKRKTKVAGAVFMASCITASSIAVGSVYKKNHAVNQSPGANVTYTEKDTTSITSTCNTTSDTSAASVTSATTTSVDNSAHDVFIMSPNESCIAPKWDDQKDGQRYNSMKYKSTEYTVGRNAISRKYLKDKIGTAEISGQDYYTDKIYKKSVDVYKLSGVSENCGVGVSFDDGSSYAYVNSDYMPKTLGQMINDLNMKNTLSFGAATYERHNGNNVNPIAFSEIRSDAVWSMLLNDENAVCEKRDVPGDTIIFSIAVDIDELGYKQMGLWITEQGYIGTNLLETGKYFYIGKDKANKFINYAMQNFPHRQLADVTVYNEPIEE